MGNVFDQVTASPSGGPPPPGPSSVFDEAETRRKSAPTNASIGARHEEGVGDWFRDVQSDLRSGGTSTLPGRIFHSMKGSPETTSFPGIPGGKSLDSGISGGTSPATAEILGGPAIGPAVVGEGLSELGTHPVKGFNKVVRGAAQAAGPILGATIPGALPAAVAYGGAGQAARGALDYFGADPDYSEAAGNAVSLAAPTEVPRVGRFLERAAEPIGKLGGGIGGVATAVKTSSPWLGVKAAPHIARGTAGVIRGAGSMLASMTPETGIPSTPAPVTPRRAPLWRQAPPEPPAGPPAGGGGPEGPIIPPWKIRNAAKAAAVAERSPEMPPVRQEADPAATEYAPAAKPGDLTQQLTDALGGEPLQRGVSLRNQGKPVSAAPELPEGFTPHDSSALKGTKYNPETREFESITQGGQHYIHGEVSPEAAQSFADAESKGKAWQLIRENPLVAKVLNGKRVAVKPGTMETSAGGMIPKAEAGMAERNAPPTPTKNAPVQQEPVRSSKPPEVKPMGLVPPFKTAPSSDLTPEWQKSLDQMRAKKTGMSDRRADLGQRQKVAQMSPEEMRKSLLTSEKTGLPNRRAFEEGNSPVIGMSDADGLKALNDKFGYDAGDTLLKNKADALRQVGLDAYHDKGDEFLYRANSPEELRTRLEKAREILKNTEHVVKLPDGTTKTFKGADFSYGVGKGTDEAEQGLKLHKNEREARGERARGELRGIVEQ